jgi:hypothetical protein
MAETKRGQTRAASPEAQLRTFVAKFAPKDQTLIREVRRALRRRFPTAYELVYDNYNFFVIGYSATERPSDAIVSLTARAGAVGICFIHGAKLHDPKKLLQGSGNQTRSIRVKSADGLSDPDVQALIADAITQSRTPLRSSGRSRLIIRSISAKQRPRRR